MKKLIAILLALLLCTGCLSAVAENGYLTLRTLLTQEEYEGFYLGQAMMGPYEVAENTIMFVLDYDNKTALLMGTNEENAGEVIVWSDIETNKVLYTMYGICNTWETIQTYVEEGTKMAVGIVFADSETGNIWVDSAERAAAFVETLNAQLELQSGTDSAAQ